MDLLTVRLTVSASTVEHEAAYHIYLCEMTLFAAGKLEGVFCDGSYLSAHQNWRSRLTLLVWSPVVANFLWVYSKEEGVLDDPGL